MNRTKNLLNLALAFLLSIILLESCSDDLDDAGDGRLRISAMATLTSGDSGKDTASKSLNTNVELTELRVNLKEFELELDDDSFEDELDDSMDENFDDDDSWDDDGYLDFEDEIELEGPFELDLLSGQITFINTTVPTGRFEEVEFEFGKGKDPQSDLFGKSILIKGNIEDTPFVFWHEFEDEVELDYDDPSLDIIITGGTEGIVINFDFSLLLSSANGLDLSSASDGNGDGTIEISPEDPDGNNDLAAALKNRIKDYIDLLDD